MKIGIQLFGLLHGLEGDVMENLRKLAETGITEVEPCAALDPPKPFETVMWPAVWLEENAEKIRAMGLSIRSVHVMSRDLAADAAWLVALAEKLGIEQYVLKSPRELSRISLHQAALNYMKLADALAPYGVKLLLHNEATDIKEKINGKSAYEYLLDLCQGKLGAQVDVGWLKFAGEDIKTFLLRNEARVKSLHYKDFPENAAEPIDVTVGTGSVDMAYCLSFAAAHNIPQYIDQERFGEDRMQEVAGVVTSLSRMQPRDRKIISFLNTYDADTGRVKTLASFDRVIEAPNWLKSSNTLLYNSGGYMYAYDIETGTERKLDTGICDHCNNDHVVSFDEKYIAVSHMSFEEGFSSRVYIVPMEGGEARLVTPNTPSFLHGWSPDGKEMAYCAFREINGKREVDVYTIPAEGGEEKRRTDGGFNDGPEYSPDGKYIWYNSTKSGLMQIWRMKTDGSEQTQITKNKKNNWFAHISPDGKRAVYLAYGEYQLNPAEHLGNMPVELWMMNADGSEQHKILSLFGGQGSLNVNSWAKDSRHFAFVSYELQ